MYNLLAITNRHLCYNNFLDQIEKICKLQDNISIVLREKDLPQDQYKTLANKVLKICSQYNKDCILHTYYDIAKELQCDKIHVPLYILKDNPYLSKEFSILGVSIHSVDEAKEAEALGATYITAGHIFKTNCKKGIPGRGLNFLVQVINSVSIPVYGIGGISQDNIKKVINTGAYGACIMSGLMSIDNPKIFFNL